MTPKLDVLVADHRHMLGLYKGKLTPAEVAETDRFRAEYRENAKRLGVDLDSEVAQAHMLFAMLVVGSIMHQLHSAGIPLEAMRMRALSAAFLQLQIATFWD